MHETHTQCCNYKNGYCIILDDKCKPTSVRCVNPLCKNKDKYQRITPPKNKSLERVGSINQKHIINNKVAGSNNGNISTHICFSDKYYGKRKCPICGFTLIYQKPMIDGLDKNLYKCCIKDRIFFIPKQYKCKLKQTKTNGGSDIFVYDEKEISNISHNTKVKHDAKTKKQYITNAQKTTTRKTCTLKTCIRCGKIEYFNGYCWDCHMELNHIRNK